MSSLILCYNEFYSVLKRQCIKADAFIDDTRCFYILDQCLFKTEDLVFILFIDLMNFYCLVLYENHG